LIFGTLPGREGPLNSTLQAPMLDQISQFPERADFASPVIENVGEMAI
jgi:hypothetical protein